MSNRAKSWLALVAWAIAMAIGWAVLVPASLSASSLAIIAVGGPALVIAAATVRRAHAPTTSIRESRVEADAAAAGGRGRK